MSSTLPNATTIVEAPSADSFPPIVVSSEGMQISILALRVISTALCLLLCATIVSSPSIKRHSFFVNYLFLLAAGTMMSLVTLINAGGHITQYPSLPIGAFQASSLFGWGVALALSDLLLASLMLLKTMPQSFDFVAWVDTKAFVLSINTAPYLVWISLFGVALDASLKSGGHYIYHQEVFCTIGIPYLRTAWNWTIVILLSATVIVDVVMALLLLRTRLSSRRDLMAHRPSSSVPRLSVQLPPLPFQSQARSFIDDSRASVQFPRSTSGVHLTSLSKSTCAKQWSPPSGLAIRVVALGAYFVVNAVLEALVISGGMARERVVVYESTRGIIIFLIFSSQHDIRAVYINNIKTVVRCLDPFPRRHVQTPDRFSPAPPYSLRPHSNSVDLEKQSNPSNSSSDAGSTLNGSDESTSSDANTVILDSPQSSLGKPTRASAGFFSQKPFMLSDKSRKSSSSSRLDGEQGPESGVQITVEVETFVDDLPNHAI